MNKTPAAGTSQKKLLLELLTASNKIDRYITQVKVQRISKSGENKKRDGIESEINNRLYNFALRCQKSAIEFYSTLTDEPKTRCDEPIWTSGNCFGKIKRAPGTTGKKNPGEEITNILRDMECMNVNTYPEDSNESSGFVVGGLLEGTHSRNVGNDLRGNLEESELTVATVWEKAPHIEAVTRVEVVERSQFSNLTKQRIWKFLENSYWILVFVAEFLSEKMQFKRKRSKKMVIKERDFGFVANEAKSIAVRGKQIEKNPQKAKAITIFKEVFWIWSRSDFSKW